MLIDSFCVNFDCECCDFDELDADEMANIDVSFIVSVSMEYDFCANANELVFDVAVVPMIEPLC